MRLRGVMLCGFLAASVVLAGAWWASGYWDLTMCDCRSSAPRVLAIRRGRVEFGFEAPGTYRRPFVLYRTITEGASRGLREWGFALHRGSGWWIAATPLWAPLLVFAGPSAFWSVRWVRWMWTGSCLGCGYTLHGVPPGKGAVRCPECGRVAVRRGGGSDRPG